MNIVQAIILGGVEGLTEFLPISSTAHLIVAQKIMGLDQNNEFFTVVVQSGAILAAIVYFRKRIIEVFTTKTNILKNIAVGILPVLIIGFFARKYINGWDNNILLLISSTIIFGIVFYAIEIWALNNNQPKKNLEKATLKDTLIMGLTQSLALIPGTSRSGATIAGGLSQNLRMSDAIDLSFLLGIPVLLIATAYKIISFRNIDANTVSMTAVGTIISFGVGLLGVHLTLGLVRKYGFLPFAFYRIGFGLILLAFYLGGFLH